MSWLYMLLGAAGLKSWQICRFAMFENDQRDIEDESWQSVRDIQ